MTQSAIHITVLIHNNSNIPGWYMYMLVSCKIRDANKELVRIGIPPSY